MKLKYKILWIEDEKISIKIKAKNIRRYLENEFGFECLESDITILDYDEFNQAYIINNQIKLNSDIEKFDLLLVDFNLGEKMHTGDKLIQIIRNSNIYSELLFYSSDLDSLLAKLNKNFIDGVFTSVRDELEDKIKKLIDVTIKKVLDLTNMRGLVIAEVSSLDLLLNDLLLNMITLLHTHSPCQRQVVIDKVFNKRLSQANEIKDIEYEYEKVNGKTSKRFIVNATEIQSHHMDISIVLEKMESSEKVEAINKLYKIVKEKVKVNDQKLALFKKYTNEIIKIRNLLAHVKEETVDGKLVLKSKVSGYKDFIISPEKFTEIRKSIILHSKNIKELNTEICKSL